MSMIQHQTPTKMQQLLKSDRRMFSSSDDSAMMKQIQSTHAPDGSEVDVKPILHIIEQIFHRSSPGINIGKQEVADAVLEKAMISGYDDILEALAYIIQKISCELSCKCSGGVDAHATTMAIFNMLSNYSWDAKVVISLAAFAVNYGEFWIVANLSTTNPLARSISLLKQVPDIIEHGGSLKSRFEAISNLINAMLEVTRCIVEFKGLPEQFISHDVPPMSTAMAHIPTAAYWTIRSVVACTSQIISLFGMSYEHISSTTEAWELSSLAHKVNNIQNHLKEQLRICHQHIDEKRHVETYQNLIRLFEMTHIDNLRILKAIIYSKDDILPLFNGMTQKRVSIEVLRRKTVLLLIADLEILMEEIMLLIQLHQDMKPDPSLQYEIVWLPIVDRTTPWTEAHQMKFDQLRSMMPWYSVYHPSLLEPAVIRYIKEVWHFTKKMILVVVDPQAKVVCTNALHMMLIWGNLAYPFSSIKEELLWKEESWRLEFIVDSIDPVIFEWIMEGRFICLYGGDDIEWIRNFTAKAKAAARSADIIFEMIYVGKSNAKERVRRINEVISRENLSHYWPDTILIWYFWARLESMLYTKMQHGRNVENDHIMKELSTVLSFDGSDQGWAIISKGPEIIKAKGDTLLTSLTEYETWEHMVREMGFVHALEEKLQQLHTPQHCNRLILPGINGEISERVICAECGRTMEKYFMYRCCTD